MGLHIPIQSVPALRAALAAEGAVFEERPSALFLARIGPVTLTAYHTGSLLITGPNGPERALAIDLATKVGAVTTQIDKADLPPLDFHVTRVGTDEAGKGEYFGPLVVAGVLATEAEADRLREIGVRDSKKLSDVAVSNMAVDIKRLLGPGKVRPVPLPPIRYNLLYAELGNVNRILGWAHARALEDLLKIDSTCMVAIADQFGDKSYIRDRLGPLGRDIDLVQTPKAERDVVVAAASVVARDAFLKASLQMAQDYGFEFPRGSNDAVRAGVDLVREFGPGVLISTAKVHFKTTSQILGMEDPLRVEIRELREKERGERSGAQVTSERLFLELFSLISAFERELRGFIQSRIRLTYGDEWWTKGIDPQIRAKAEKLQAQEEKRGRRPELIDCLDFGHYEYILNSKENWETIFKPVFGDSNSMIHRLRVLQEIRNPTAHSRSFQREDKHAALGAIAWLRRKMVGNEARAA